MYFIISAIIVLVDQLSKFSAVKYLRGNSPYVIIDNLFQLYYVENYGAAFGILQNGRIFFLVITSIVIVFIIVFMTRYSNNLNNAMKITLAMLLGGAIGNFIDRFRLGYVVDLFSVKLPWGYNFPVFNVADIFLVVSTALVMIMIVFNKYEN